MYHSHYNDRCNDERLCLRTQAKAEELGSPNWVVVFESYLRYDSPNLKGSDA